MATTNKKNLHLSFSTAGGKTFSIVLDNPIADVQPAAAMAVMQLLIDKDIIETPSGELTGVRDIKVVDVTTDDLYTPQI